VEKFLLRVEILRWDSAAAKYYITPPRSRTDRRPDGKSLDMMIAAQALSAPAMLVRHDMSSIG
jgi:hypothetical protein